MYVVFIIYSNIVFVFTRNSISTNLYTKIKEIHVVFNGFISDSALVGRPSIYVVRKLFKGGKLC